MSSEQTGLPSAALLLVQAAGLLQGLGTATDCPQAVLVATELLKLVSQMTGVEVIITTQIEEEGDGPPVQRGGDDDVLGSFVR